MKKLDDSFSGILATVLIPITQDLSYDLAKMIQLKNGYDGLEVLGSTGKANSFSLDEQSVILFVLVKDQIPVNALMPGTGMDAIPNPVGLTKSALWLGAKKS